MNNTSRWLGRIVFTFIAGWTSWAGAQNQTPTLTPVTPSNDVPFNITIETAFQLPSGLQSFVVGNYGGKWLLLAGRINGLHGFGGSNNFPANLQNTTVFVVDPVRKTTVTRLLTAPNSGLTQAQVDLLSAGGAQYYQVGTTLYMCGGYGVDTATNDFTTKPALTAINVAGLMHWVTAPRNGETAAQYIRTVFNPIFQMSGGTLIQLPTRQFLLTFGEGFEGTVGAATTGTYSGQIRRFVLRDNLRTLTVVPQAPLPANPDPNFERTDLNVVSTYKAGRLSYTAFSGVFTPGNGIWTVPIEISATGVPTMADPTLAGTFKQAMNNYECPTLGLYSRKTNSSYTVFMGGISYGFFQNSTFQTDSELPFINQVTTIKRDANGVYTQVLMDGTYPEILSTASNPGNPLLFGAAARFIPSVGLRLSSGVVPLDLLPLQARRGPVVVGYIVGGIQSTLPNTNTSSDSAASPYVFKVSLTPRP